MGHWEIEARRDCYGAGDAVRRTLTAGDLIDWLEANCDRDEKIIMSHDSGYTYGWLSMNRFEWVEEDEEV